MTKRMALAFIDTPRLLLRPWQDSDHAPFAAMNADPEVMRYFPALLTPGETEAMILRIEKFITEHGYGLFAIERKDTGSFIGYTGLSHPRFESFFTPCIEIGWRLAKAHWGQGFAQEAARAWLQTGFGQLGIREIYSFTSLLNKPSINVMQKIGMKEVGQLEHPAIADGHPLRPHVLYRKVAAD